METKIPKNIKISVIITTIISVIAIIISIRNCQISKKSSDSAEEANRIAIASIKPILILEAHKFEDGSFLRINIDSDTRGTVDVDFRIKNNSPVAVKNVRIPELVFFDETKLSDSVYVLNPTQRTLIAPEQEIFITLSSKFGLPDKEKFDKYINGIEENKNPFNVRMQVIYNNDIEKDIEYSVFSTYKIFKNLAILVESGTTEKNINESQH